MLIALVRGKGEVSQTSDYDILDTDDGIIETINGIDLLNLRGKVVIDNLDIHLDCSFSKIDSFICNNRRWILQYENVSCYLIFENKMVILYSTVKVLTFCLRDSKLDIFLRNGIWLDWVNVDLNVSGTNEVLLSGNWRIKIVVRDIQYEAYLRRCLTC